MITSEIAPVATPERRSPWPLAAGLALLALLWLGPLPEMSRTAFSAHMILHLGIVAVAAPLLAIGMKRVGFGLNRLRPGLKSAAAASVFDFVMVWAWHAPPLHEAASRDLSVFALQQVSFLAAGLLIWGVAFAGDRREDAGAGAVAMLATFMHMTMLGALLALAPALIYAPDVCIGAFGFERLEDQRFGGTLMAIAGGLPFLAGGLVLVHRLIGEDVRPRGPSGAN